MTVSELATRLEISKQGAGQIVDDMERCGYLQRRPDPHARRAWLVEPSPRGAAALAAAREIHRRYQDRLIREHGGEAVDTIRAMLTAVAGDAAEDLDPRLRALYL